MDARRERIFISSALGIVQPLRDFAVVYCSVHIQRRRARVAKLSTDYISVLFVPLVIAHPTPGLIVINLYQTLSSWWASNQTNCEIEILTGKRVHLIVIRIVLHCIIFSLLSLTKHLTMYFQWDILISYFVLTWGITDNTGVFAVRTILYLPSVMFTVCYCTLIAYTLYCTQPYFPCSLSERSSPWCCYGSVVAQLKANDISIL